MKTLQLDDELAKVGKLPARLSPVRSAVVDNHAQRRTGRLRPTSRAGKSASARSSVARAATISWFPRRPLTASTGIANSHDTDRAAGSRRERLAAPDFQHGPAAAHADGRCHRVRRCA